MGVDPIEVEVNAFLDGFLAAINAEDLTNAMKPVDGSLQYFWVGNPAGPVPNGYHTFQNRLSAFFQNASSITVSLAQRGVSPRPGSETLADVRANLVCSYTDASGTARTLNETCEMVVEQVSVWSIISLSRFSQQPMVFPP